MTFFAEIGGLAYDIITPFFNIRDPFCSISQRLYFDIIPYGDRICATNTTDAEIAFYMAFRIQTIVHADDVTATRRFND